MKTKRIFYTPTKYGLYEGDIFEYIEELFSTLLNAQVVDFENSSSDLKRSIRIDNLGISATNFMLTEAQQQALFDSGVKYTTNFLNQI